MGAFPSSRRENAGDSITASCALLFRSEGSCLPAFTNHVARVGLWDSASKTEGSRMR